MNHEIKLIVGLGNPGTQYVRTRHNAGEDYVEQLARSANTSLTSDSKFFGRSAKITLGTQSCFLLVPTTFMNKSGQSVAALANFYKIKPEEILVAHDELDLKPGIAKLKFKGGHGGHNGLRDIISCLGNSRDFYRLRIGIGHPGSAAQVSNYVLSKASPNDQIAIDTSISNAIAVSPLAVKGDWNTAMKQLHT